MNIGTPVCWREIASVHNCCMKIEDNGVFYHFLIVLGV